ncbi:SGNH/GDSL hydrolase family protein [Streptomyces sp. NPDC049040]|uniref:SGNH/GDSL hydrolase family protein n=1 Tax=Streptomyces sp. NPDC049040 TaxID=3365593 RepID=UPI0037194ABF
MRPLLRNGLALALGAVLLGGCSSGGSPDGGRASTAGSPSAHTSHSTREAAPAPPARPWNVHPASVAALGDSITRGFDACKPLSDCPEVSWATGSRTAVGSITSRLTAARSWNVADTGARVADLAAQAREAAAYKPAMVTILIGANDACTSGPATMTTVAHFRTRFDAALAYLHKTLPTTQILVASIPDLERLWSIGRSNMLGKQVWKLGLCPSMLGDADSLSAAAKARRAAVRDRVVAYNQVLGQVCGRYARCRYDGGAVFGYRFGTDELSTWDWFHPNAKGQEQLAALLAAVAFRPQEKTG